MSPNLKARKQQSYDAIVVGTGISGGWAAKELCEKGLKTLVLERGRMVKHLVDYPTMLLHPWELPYGDRLTPQEIEEDYPVQSKTAYAVKQSTKHFFINDWENPYIQEKPFYWTRGNQVGGKSLTWGRWAYRWSDYDFGANARDGVREPVHDNRPSTGGRPTAHRYNPSHLSPIRFANLTSCDPVAHLFKLHRIFNVRNSEFPVADLPSRRLPTARMPGGDKVSASSHPQ